MRFYDGVNCLSEVYGGFKVVSIVRVRFCTEVLMIPSRLNNHANYVLCGFTAGLIFPVWLYSSVDFSNVNYPRELLQWW